MSEYVFIPVRDYYDAREHWLILTGKDTYNYGQFTSFLGYGAGELGAHWNHIKRGWDLPVSKARLIQLLSSPHYHALWKAYQIREAANAVR